MSAGNFHGIVNGSIEPNGTPAREPVAARETVRPRGGRRPAPTKRIERVAKPAPELAGFVKAESQAQDAPMWPIHPAMWLQPELRLHVPAASGLRNERQHSAPSPEFVRGTMKPAGRTSPIEKTVHPVVPRVAQRLPASGLAPLGWDPRVASHTTLKEDQE